MAKKQVKRWFVRRIPKFRFETDICYADVEGLRCKAAITHEGLKALEQAKKGAK